MSFQENVRVHVSPPQSRLSSPDDMLGHPGVQDRPHASTTAVSTALAARLCIRDPDLTLPERGVTIVANICPAVIYTRTAACPFWR